MIRHVCEMKMLRKFNCNVKQLSFNDTYADWLWKPLNQMEATTIAQGEKGMQPRY